MQAKPVSHGTARQLQSWSPRTQVSHHHVIAVVLGGGVGGGRRGGGRLPLMFEAGSRRSSCPSAGWGTARGSPRLTPLMCGWGLLQRRSQRSGAAAASSRLLNGLRHGCQRWGGWRFRLQTLWQRRGCKGGASCSTWRV